MEHPVGTGAFRLVSGGARRASCSSAARATATRSATSNRRGQPGARRVRRRASQGPQTAAAGSHRGRDHRRRRNRAGSPSSTARSTSSTRCRPVRRDGAANNELAPNLSKRGIRMVRYPRADVAVSYFNMEDRSSAATRPTRWRCAARSAWPSTSTGRSADPPQPGDPGQSHVGPGVWGYDPAFRSEMSEFNRPGAGAAGTCTDMSTATATAGASCPTADRSCSVRDPARPGLARATEQWKRTWTRSACASSSKPPSGPPEGLFRRQADDVGRRLDRDDARTRRIFSTSRTVRTRARPTSRAFAAGLRPRLSRAEGAADGPSGQALIDGPSASSSRTCRFACTCTASSPTSCSPGSSATTATCSPAWTAPGATSTSTRGCATRAA